MGGKSCSGFKTLLQINKILRHAAGAGVKNSNWTLQKRRYLDYQYDKCPKYPFCVRGVRAKRKCDPRNCKFVNNSASNSSEMIIGYGIANVAIGPYNEDRNKKHNNWFSTKLVRNR